MSTRRHWEIDWLRLLCWWSVGAIGIVGGIEKVLGGATESGLGYAAIAIGLASFVGGSITAVRRIQTRPAAEPEVPQIGERASQLSHVIRRAVDRDNSENDVNISRFSMYFNLSVDACVGQKLASVHYVVPGGNPADDLTPLGHVTDSCWGLELVMEQANLALFFVGQDPTTLDVTLGDRSDPPEGTIRRIVSEVPMWKSAIGQELRAVIPTQAIGFANQFSWRDVDPTILATVKQNVMDSLSASGERRFDSEAFLRYRLATNIRSLEPVEVSLVFESMEVHVQAENGGLELSRTRLKKSPT